LRSLLVVALSFALLAALLLIWRGPSAGAATEASLRFSHQKHLAAGVPCLFCHPGATDRPVAGIPSLAKCVGCHQNVQVQSEEGRAYVELLLSLWEEGQPLQWPRIYDMPDFVYFAHRPHIAAGKSCENCHGDMTQMSMARKAYRINMGFCLQNCHRHQDAVQRERLMSCATCHK
jgi:hypothetical protein